MDLHVCVFGGSLAFVKKLGSDAVADLLLLLLMVLLLPQSHLQSTLPQSWPVNRLMAEGVALFNLAAAADGGVFRDVLIKFFVPSRPLPFHTFSQV